MRWNEQGMSTIRARAALGVLVATTACQLVIDTDFTFTPDAAGTGVGNLDPSPPSRPEVDAGAPLQPVIDATSEPEPSPRGDPDAGEMEAGAPPPDGGLDSPAPEPPPPVEPELPPDPTNGCSWVDYCKAYEELDTSAEELCRQLGCSLDEAIAECRAEITSVCGPNSAPPYAITALSGDERVFY